MNTRISDRSGMNGRRLLLLLSLAALPLWGLLLLFTHFVAPQSIISFLIFFLLLGLALLSTFTPPIYLVTRRVVAARLYRVSVRHAMRQAGLIDAWIIFNLLLRLLHSWNLLTAGISFGIIVVLELLSLSHK